MKTEGITVEHIQGGLSAEDAARAEAVRNQSESTTTAGAWRMVESNAKARAASLDEREGALRRWEESLREREGQVVAKEAAAHTAVRDAEIQAREAGSRLLEDASVRATAILRSAFESASVTTTKAFDEAASLGQKAAVDAGAIRQAAQDHLVAGIALADSARIPAAAPPSGAQIFGELGKTLIGRAAGLFEKLMLANPEASAKLAVTLATAVSPENEGTPAPAVEKNKSPTFGDVATAAEAMGEEALQEFLRTRGATSLRDLTVEDGVALLDLQHSLGKERGGGNDPR